MGLEDMATDSSNSDSAVFHMDNCPVASPATIDFECFREAMAVTTTEPSEDHSWISLVSNRSMNILPVEVPPAMPSSVGETHVITPEIRMSYTCSTRSSDHRMACVVDTRTDMSCMWWADKKCFPSGKIIFFTGISSSKSHMVAMQ